LLTKTTESLVPGDVLAEALHSPDGAVLLRAGVELTPQLIDAVTRRGFMSVHVRDGLADDVLPQNVVSTQVRTQISGTVGRLFGGLNSAAVSATADGHGRAPISVDAASARMGEDPLALDRGTADALAAAQDAVVSLIDTVCAGAIGGLESLKTHNEYTFQHSVDVAITGVLLGHRLGLTGEEMEHLALGCLVHDIGKTFLDTAILDKPGKLTDEERIEVERHPEMGFEIVRRLPLTSILPAHVAYQHHERQDGMGYPRGLIGANRVARNEQERLNGKRMLLIAEIAAVADVHSALTSDRPYRAAMPSEKADRILGEMATRHLNREVVETLRRLAPLYPVGSWVEITEGPASLVGWRAVVTDTTDPRRPVIRVIVDPNGEPHEGQEVDLGVQPEVDVRSLPASAHPQDAAVSIS
jgi:HD-GYP domain-containing protein (c-di-GMP phosphodiesterase class II)